MVRFTVHGPHWFFGVDAALELVAGIVALLIVLAGIRYARIAKDRNYLPLPWGFGLISASFIAQVVTTVILYHEFSESIAAGAGRNIVLEISSMFYVGHVLYIIFSVLGLLVLAFWALRIKDTMHRLLLTALTLLLAVLSIDSTLIFHVVALILLVFICVKFFLNARENGMCAWEVFAGFVCMALARVAFLLEPMNDQLYVGAYFLQLLSYLILFLVLVQVVRKR